VIATLGALLIAVSTPALPAGVRAQIDAMAHAAIAHQHLAGLSIAIARRGVVLYAAGYGYRDLARRLPADAETIYNVASNSKQFTAAAIMLLAQDHKLSIDDRLSRFFPWYRFGDRITIRELLNHASGIPDYTELPDVPHVATALRFFQLVAGKPLEFPPGTRYRYCNTNYVILGIIVEKVSGTTLARFMRRHFFAPLEMTRSSARLVPLQQPDGAVGYTLDGNRIVQMPQTPDDLGYGDGTVDASVTDLVKWDEALDSGRVVDAGSWRLMTSPPRPEWPGADLGYGFGLDIGSLYGYRQISHYGLNPGFATFNATYPGLGLEIVTISNSDQFIETLLEQRILALLAPVAPTAAQRYASEPGENAKVTALAMRWLYRLQHGIIDPKPLTASLAKNLTPAAAIAMTRATHATGEPAHVQFVGEDDRFTSVDFEYLLYFKNAVVDYAVTFDPTGKIEDIALARAD
jgi:D-alanyl-D-alanine carboxypeptidase